MQRGARPDEFADRTRLNNTVLSRADAFPSMWHGRRFALWQSPSDQAPTTRTPGCLTIRRDSRCGNHCPITRRHCCSKHRTRTERAGSVAAEARSVRRGRHGRSHHWLVAEGTSVEVSTATTQPAPLRAGLAVVIHEGRSRPPYCRAGHAASTAQHGQRQHAHHQKLAAMVG